MVTSRVFFLGLIALFGTGLVRGQDTPADPTAVKKATMASAEPRISFNSIHVDGPYIAMTFDDGPNEKLTPKLLDLLAAHHIKATFFVIGQNVAENPQILARAAREGHEIGNHTWSHPNLAKMSDEGVRREIRRTDELIKAVEDAVGGAYSPSPGLVYPTLTLLEDLGYIAAGANDRFVLRIPSPPMTIAGGRFVDVAPRKHPRHDAAVSESLDRRAAGEVGAGPAMTSY